MSNILNSSKPIQTFHGLSGQITQLTRAEHFEHSSVSNITSVSTASISFISNYFKRLWHFKHFGHILASEALHTDSTSDKLNIKPARGANLHMLSISVGCEISDELSISTSLNIFNISTTQHATHFRTFLTLQAFYTSTNLPKHLYRLSNIIPA